MGREKDAIAQREEGFKMKAESEGWNCAVCGATPIYDERDVYLERGLCGSCAHQADKDD